MVTKRLYAVAAFSVLCALGAVTAAFGAAHAVNPDLKAPTLLGPTHQQAIQPGTAVTFRIRTHARDVGLMLRVSRSAVRGTCGVIRGEVARGSFARTGTPQVYTARPAGATLATSWLNTPGTYYWQAYRIAGRDGCVESSVRALQVMPRPSLALNEARLEGRFDLTERITAIDGFGGNVGDTGTVTYTFTPSCASGACDTGLSFEQEGAVVPSLTHTVTIPLTWSDIGYTGSGPASLSACGMVAVDGTLEYRIEVSTAAWSGSTWRATGVVGHMKYTTPESTGGVFETCPPGLWEADLSGTR